MDSRTKGAAQQGNDFEKVVDQIQDEEEYAEERGVNVGGLKRADLFELGLVDENGKKTPAQAQMINRLTALLNGGSGDGSSH